MRRIRAAAAHAQARQWADDAQRQAATRKAEVQRAVAAQRQAAQLQYLTHAEAARRRAETDRVAALEAAVERLGAPAAAAPSPASPPVPASEAAPPPAAPPLALDVRSRATLEGKWAGELGVWQFAFTIRSGEISGTLSCANTVYRLREKFAGGRALDITANRLVGRSEFPTTMGVKGDFPTLRLKPLSAPPFGCDNKPAVRAQAGIGRLNRHVAGCALRARHTVTQAAITPRLLWIHSLTRM